jgi:hypothetical protein
LALNPAHQASIDAFKGSTTMFTLSNHGNDQ